MDGRVELHAVLPDVLTGKTVLDVGCGNGHTARVMARRGATVVAVDVDEDCLAGARELSAIESDRIDFVLGDLEVQLPAGRFDHVICHNLLHRVRNPLLVLDHLIEATGSSLVLDVTGPADERPQRLLRRDFGAEPSVGLGLATMPLAVVGRNGTPHRKREQKLYFSPSAMHNLLMEQRRYFASCEVVPSRPAGRYVTHAVRRVVDDLTIVTGPTGSGKSTLLARLERGDPSTSSVADRVGVRTHSHAVTNGDGVARLPAEVPRVLLHYDLLRPWRRDARVHERDEALHIVASCRKLTVVVLVARRSVLRHRLEAELDCIADPETRGAKRLREVLRLYSSDADRLVARIEAWLDFCHRRGASVHFVDSSDERYRSLDGSDWRDLIAEV